MHDLALVHIVENLLEAKGKPIERFIKAYGFTKPVEFTSISPNEIKDFEFQDANSVSTKLSPLDCGKIRAFQGYIRYRYARNDPIEDGDWSTITLALFDGF